MNDSFNDDNHQYKLYADQNNYFPNMKCVSKQDEIPIGTEVNQINLNSIAQICGCTLDNVS